MIDLYEKVKCENVELINDNGQLYLSVRYLLENESEIVRLNIPRIQLPINLSACPQIEYSHAYNDWINYRGQKPYIRCGYRDQLAIEKHNDITYTLETVENKTHKLTVAEIEKKLGYKIEIVSEESKK